ncbi:zinc ribbon domain-containing protein [Streptomyces sp. NPDC002889]|uniref:zinc ribbon domain-containing protein n=1 Tax=Streptomyces sp. NPDC002889 TaxID=3364669 RepID=UPI0036773525
MEQTFGACRWVYNEGLALRAAAWKQHRRFFPSTRRCSACHVKGPRLDVSVRGWACRECGVVHDRDVNAAVNVRDEGMLLYWLVAMALPLGRHHRR